MLKGWIHFLCLCFKILKMWAENHQLSLKITRLDHYYYTRIILGQCVISRIHFEFEMYNHVSCNQITITYITMKKITFWPTFLSIILAEFRRDPDDPSQNKIK